MRRKTIQAPQEAGPEAFARAKPDAEGLAKRKVLRVWKGMSDEELLIHAERYIKERSIKSRQELIHSDSGLNMVLRRRVLMDRIVFPRDERRWMIYSDDMLIAHAKQVMSGHEITGRFALQKHDHSFYGALLERGLLDKIGFQDDERAWRRYSDAKLLEYAWGRISELGLKRRSDLERADVSLYAALTKRRLLTKLRFERDRSRRSKGFLEGMNEDELVRYAQTRIDGLGAENKRMLQDSDQTLYTFLRQKGVLVRLSFERIKRDFSRMADGTLIKCAKELMSKHSISKRSQLQHIDASLYHALHGRDLLGRLGFEGDKRRWSLYDDPKLVEYATKLVRDNNIPNKTGLVEFDVGLWGALVKRGLLDSVFRPIDQARETIARIKGLQEIAEALDELGGRG